MRKEQLGQEIKFELHDNNKIFLIYKDNYENFTIFYGIKSLDTNSKISEDFIKFDREYYSFENNQEIFLEIEDKENLWVGEMIVFKKKFINVNEEFIIDLFNSINNGLKRKIWRSLKESLEQISELLENDDKKSIEKKIKGYIGEMSFVKYLIDNKEKELAKKVLIGYQKKENKKHDFNFSNSKTKIEVKSTSGDRLDFVMKLEQQKMIEDIKLFYVFVKYDFTELKEEGISLKEMTEWIFTELSTGDLQQPNHLIINSEKYDFNRFLIDFNSIEIFIIESQDLPKFNNGIEETYISEIKYKLNIIDFINSKEKEYKLDSMIEEIKNNLMEVENNG
ncbi:PD-(D/E)XK motif protein [Mesoplasma florum]|uniref:PD-(D/E)XK motif protein n=1 Tax=Mesoplasma florum TaxID=2151 RepID=UPI000D03F312|nr:PD-(D/E)XK motif protein [Mesoplasma florum]AVN58940.1 hypothetical protein CG009_01715 [Mesoplasma florum]